MGSTEKVSLSLDAGALVLARRAAELEGRTLSGFMSRLVLRHAWESERPALSAGVQDRSDAAVVALDEREEQLGAGAGAAGEWCASG